ncbi:MAG: flagellar hook-basal body complex protein FliE [Caulobacter sp.]|nr:flagellar hook-basal body complex protein FliE [Caulobacter sp.]
MLTALAAAKAYAAASSAAAPGITGAATGGQGFGELLKSVMSDATQASKAAETQIAAQVSGKAELIDVVTAISSAEASLETVMAVRDQVISAYQEIMRMPI